LYNLVHIPNILFFIVFTHIASYQIDLNSSSSLALNWRTFAPEEFSTPSVTERYPRARPRYLHAVATHTPPAASSETVYTNTGQITFWFGGMAMEEHTAHSITRPAPLLSDLWMFDVLANTTMLLSGDPALEDLPVRLPGSIQSETELTRGQYHPALRPAARHSAALAYDPITKLIWLYGGAQSHLVFSAAAPGADGAQAMFGDLWSFDPARQQWAWWHGSVAASSLGISGPLTASLGPPPLAAASLSARNGTLLLFGGLMMSDITLPSDGSMYFELDSALTYTVSTGEWKLVAGGLVEYSGATLAGKYPYPGTTSTPAARAYPMVTLSQQYSSETLLTLYMYGGVLFRLQNDELSEQSAELNAADSSVLAGLWKLSVASGSGTWTRLDELPLARCPQTAATRGCRARCPAARGTPAAARLLALPTRTTMTSISSADAAMHLGTLTLVTLNFLCH